jgi:hypothetical protein
MNYNKECDPVCEPKQPDFGAIISELSFQVDRSIEIVKNTTYLANNLKQIREQKSDGLPQVKKEESGVIGVLWSHLHRLREANDIANSNYEHMRDIIGS